jgi:hypothetical protein
MIYHKDHTFFTTPNEINSYWAGFIAADGSISKRGNALRITLSAKDKEHLQKFSSLVCKDYLLREYQQERQCGLCDYVSFSLASQDWKTDLSQHWGINPNKTLTITFPDGLSPENTKAFICGYIDGDGCVYVDKNRKNKIQLSICGTLEMLEGMKRFFEKEGNIRFSGEQIYATKQIYTFMVGGRTAIKVLDFLYDNRLPLMERKWGQYLEQREINNPRTYEIWTENDNEIIKKYHPTMSVRQMKDKFFPNRTYTSIEKRCNYLGLKKHYEIKWTESEDELLSKLRKETKLKIREIHEKHFSYRTFSSVKNRARLHKKT